MSVEKLAIGNTVSFDVYPEILGTPYQRVRVLAVLDMDTTRYLNFDPVAMHANVYPSLPAGTPNRPDGYSYLKLRLENGTITCVGIPWIREDSIELHTGGSLKLMWNNVTEEQRNRIIITLRANGQLPDSIV